MDSESNILAGVSISVRSESLLKITAELNLAMLKITQLLNSLSLLYITFNLFTGVWRERCGVMRGGNTGSCCCLGSTA